MNKSNHHGFHIIRTPANLNATYLGENGEFVGISKALIFTDHVHAADYANFYGIQLGKVHNVIVRCTCFDFVRADYPVANVKD